MLVHHRQVPLVALQEAGLQVGLEVPRLESLKQGHQCWAPAAMQEVGQEEAGTSMMDDAAVDVGEGAAAGDPGART